MARLLLAVGFAFCLVQIWWPAYYMTGDGPCHVYNAQIVRDLWAHSHTAFYERFYTIVYQPNPNWFTTVILALLMFVVKGAVAEQLMLTIYLVVFSGGFYLLLRKISNNDHCVPLILFTFVFTHSLAMGFYNFSFSIAFYFWVVWSWLCFLEQRKASRALLFVLFLALIFFTHLVAFVFAVFTCAALVLSFAVAYAQADARNKFSGYFLKYALLLAAFIAPFMVLMNWFTQKQGGLNLALGNHPDRLFDLYKFNYIINATEGEVGLAKVSGIVLILLFCFAFMGIKYSLKVSKYSGFLLTFLFVLVVYYFFPDDMFGITVMLTQRVQVFVFLLMACCIAYLFPKGWIKNAGSVLLLGCFICLTVVRTRCQVTAGRAEADYMSGVSNIKPSSVVLALNFSPNGTDADGKIIADRNYLFSHGSQYLGTEKPLIILDNYEANTGYFPIWWNEGVNPYHHLSHDEGIEGWPPYARIAEYKQTSGVTIDYVLMWCYNDSYLSNKHFSELYTEINAGYHIIYTSPTRRTILFEKNHL